MASGVGLACSGPAQAAPLPGTPRMCRRAAHHAACSRRPPRPASTPRHPALPHPAPLPAQVWMNERMMRVSPQSAARFITAFSDGRGAVGDSTWLVWEYEGDYTLADLMQVRLCMHAAPAWNPVHNRPFCCSALARKPTRRSRSTSPPSAITPFSLPPAPLLPAEEGVSLQPGAVAVRAGAQHPQGPRAQGRHHPRRAAAAAGLPRKVPLRG